MAGASSATPRARAPARRSGRPRRAQPHRPAALGGAAVPEHGFPEDGDPVNSGPWRFLMYLVLPQPAKMALLPEELRGQLDRINLVANVGMYSGSGATAYDATHRYAEADH